MIYTISGDTAGLGRDLENAVNILAQWCPILAYLVDGDACVDLGCGDPFMSQHLADCLQR